MDTVKPIFLFCLPRSGSTLLQKLIGTQSQVQTVSEPWLMLPLVYSRRKRGAVSEYSHQLASVGINDLIDHFPNKRDDFEDELAEFVKSLYGKTMDDDHQFFLDKTPRYYFIIDEIMSIFPDGKFVFLFRNPIEVFASVLNSWYEGRLRFENHYQDLYRGPKCLADGFRKHRQRSIRVNYAEITESPEEACGKIFDYLDLDADMQKVREWNDTELQGHWGDKQGKQYDQISQDPHEKWKRVFDTSYRQRVLQDYLEFFDPEVFDAFGYEKHDLIERVQQLDVREQIGLADRLDLILTNLHQVFDKSLIKDKFKRKLESIPFLQRYS